MDFSLTEQQRELQAVARQFAYDELLPASMAADAQTDPADCHSAAMIARCSELGLRTMKVPVEQGGLGVDCVTEVIVLEELCTADVGFGMTMQHAWREGYALATYVSPSLRDEYLPRFLADPTCATSLAMSEYDFGSDSSGHSTDPADGPRTRAERSGDGWIINGRKRYITNASLAQIVFVACRTDPTVPWRRGVTMFFIPTDVPGYSSGDAEDKLGIRMNINADMILEDVRLSDAHRVGEVGGGAAMLATIGRGAKVKTATKALGVARAAFEEGVAFACQRVQGGKPIIRHQSVAASLVEVEMRLEAVRSMIWRTAWLVDQRRPEAPRFESMCKAMASELAKDASVTALEIHASHGLNRGTRVEKLLRDGAATLHTGVGNHALRAVLGEALAAGAGDEPLVQQSGL